MPNVLYASAILHKAERKIILCITEPYLNAALRFFITLKTKNIKPILFLGFLFFISLTSFAQQGLDTKISLICKKTPLKQILNQITDKSGLLFSYNPAQINDTLQIDIYVKNKPVSSVIEQLGGILGFVYLEVENQIILKNQTKHHNDEKEIEIKNPVLSGYVLDSISKEALIGATVSIDGKSIGTVTNGYGYYSLPLKKDKYTIVYSYLGYKRKYVTVNLTHNTILNEKLAAETSEIEAIAVTKDNNKNTLTDVMAKNSSINAKDFSKYAGLILGGDLVGLLATDNGIVRQSDGSAFYSVHGGYKDQNLVLIDDAPIYHPSHLFGFFSTVAPDAVNAVDVYSSDFPLRYGGRLSSITDIRTKDGSMGKWVWSGEFTPFTVSNRMEIPIYKDKITFTGNFRNSTLNWLAHYLDLEGENGFNDLHAKLHLKTSNKSRVYLSVFRGGDKYSNLQMGNNCKISWQNLTATVRHYRVLTPKFTMNNLAYFGDYHYNLTLSENYTNYWRTRICNISFKSDYVYSFAGGNVMRFGFDYSYHIFVPAKLFSLNEKEGRGIESGNADNIVVYVGGESKLGEKVGLKYGARLSAWGNYGPSLNYFYNQRQQTWDTLRNPKGKYNTFVNVEPRFSAVYMPITKLSLKISYEHNYQYLHLLSNSISPFTTLDLWIPAGKYFKPQSVDNVTFTSTYTSAAIKFTLCGFYKYYTNQPEYADHANILLNQHIERSFFLGNAKSLGVEAGVEKSVGLLMFKLNYSYSQSRRYTPDIQKERYIADYDVPHSVYVMVQYKMLKRLVLKGDWNCNSGAPYTRPEGFYFYQNRKIPYYGSRNNARLPLNHKLNVAFQYQFGKPWPKNVLHSLTISVYNVYNRTNFVLRSYNKIETSDGEFEIPSNYIKDTRFVSTGISMPGIFPMLIYKIEIKN